MPCVILAWGSFGFILLLLRFGDVNDDAAESAGEARYALGSIAEMESKDS
jgi:hypothetical protein